MSKNNICHPVWKASNAALVIAILLLQSAHGQTFDDGLMDRVRSVSHMIPGKLPVEVRFQDFFHWKQPLSGLYEGGSPEIVDNVIGVFQIRFSDGWIMVDAAVEKELLWDGDFSNGNYALIGDGLRGARMIVATHEHSDHIAGVIRGPWASAAEAKSLLTTEQLETIVAGPSYEPEFIISQEHADRFVSVKYDELLPIAPGVVLIKAPGHSPGSQIVYVLLHDNTEMLLVGDVIWNTGALDNVSQKPMDASVRLNEDREAILPQMKWLKSILGTSTHLVVAHDAKAMSALIEKGVIRDGIILGTSD